MCGRYILQQIAAAERYFGLQGTPWTESYNVAPSQPVATVRAIQGTSVGETMRWGLIPRWAHGTPPKYSTINATIERLESGSTWRGPWRAGQRCILPASGFYEWQSLPAGKQPYFIHAADRPRFGFAGLWEASRTKDGIEVLSCTIITLPASPLMAEIHNTKRREPAILAEADHDAWLTGTAEQARAALRQYPDELLDAYRVSSRVNSPRNQGPDLLERV